MAYLGTPIDTTNQFQSLQGKRFSGDGSTTAFTLDVAPSSVFDIEVFVENVRQDPNSAYNISGTTLTFTGAPSSGTNNIYVVHQAKAVGTISPAAGTVNADSFDNTVISGHTALATKPDATDEFLVSDAGTIKRIDYSLLTPISTVGMWRINTGTDLSADTETTITAGWEEVDSDSYTRIGSAMSQSSGVWTFPETGIYQILWNVQFKDPQAAGNRCTTVIAVTTDNSSYSTATDNSGNFNDTSSRASILASHIFDVTNTSTHKCKLNAICTGTVTLHSADAQSRTWVQFIRLGDT